MNEARPHSPVLGISTRDMIFAFILSKFIATAAAAVVAGVYPELQRLAVTLGSVTSVVILVLLVMVGGKQSIRQVIAATAVAHKPSCGVLLWVAVAILAGLAFRFGNSGVVLGFLYSTNPDSVAAELADLTAALSDSTNPLDALAPLLVLINATNEEIVYRRILQTCFCRRFGLTAGVLGVAVVFGGIHGSWPAMLSGIWLGLLYIFSGRLWVVALAHAVANLAVYLMAAMQRPATQELFFVACYASAGSMLAAMIWAAVTVRKSPWRRH